MEEPVNKISRGVKIAFCVGVLILLIVNLIYSLQKPKVEVVYVNTDSIRHTVDSLEIQVQHLVIERKEIVKVIEESEKKVEVINDEYKKKHNTIVIQPTDSDCVFFSNYLSKEFK
jgi:hypothetical protein